MWAVAGTIRPSLYAFGVRDRVRDRVGVKVRVQSGSAKGLGSG